MTEFPEEAELARAIKNHAPPQVIANIKRRVRQVRGKTKSQREMDLLMRKIDSEYRDPSLQQLASKVYPVEKKEVFCPNCGKSTRGNTINGVPYCFTCNRPVNSKTSQGPKMRIISKEESRSRFLSELNPGLHPKE